MSDSQVTAGLKLAFRLLISPAVQIYYTISFRLSIFCSYRYDFEYRVGNYSVALIINPPSNPPILFICFDYACVLLTLTYLVSPPQQPTQERQPVRPFDIPQLNSQNCYPLKQTMKRGNDQDRSRGHTEDNPIDVDDSDEEEERLEQNRSRRRGFQDMHNPTQREHHGHISRHDAHASDPTSTASASTAARGQWEGLYIPITESSSSSRSPDKAPARRVSCATLDQPAMEHPSSPRSRRDRYSVDQRPTDNPRSPSQSRRNRFSVGQIPPYRSQPGQRHESKKRPISAEARAPRSPDAMAMPPPPPPLPPPEQLQTNPDDFNRMNRAIRQAETIAVRPKQPATKPTASTSQRGSGSNKAPQEVSSQNGGPPSRRQRSESTEKLYSEKVSSELGVRSRREAPSNNEPAGSFLSPTRRQSSRLQQASASVAQPSSSE